jgi:hypothetical protein
MHNEWSDVLANLLLIKGHPFTSKLLFDTIFVEKTYDNHGRLTWQEDTTLLKHQQTVHPLNPNRRQFGRRFIHMTNMPMFS